MTVEKLYDTPPTSYLKQLANTYCNIISVYIYLWENKDENNMCTLEKSQISKLLLIERKTFMPALHKICRLGLCNFVENDTHVKIELVGWD